MNIKNTKVVIIEDTKFYREYLKKFCQEHNFNPICYNSGDEFVKQLDTIEADIFLLDIEMPGINGFEVCQKIRFTERLSDIPILFLSSNSSEDYVARGFIYGANDYITKPVNDIILMSRMKNQLEQIRTKRLLQNYITELLTVNKRLKKEEAKAVKLANYDFLTNIYNRRKFSELLKKSIKSGEQVNLAIIDIDDFKTVNDNYGHKVGDEVIVKSTQNILDIVKSKGTLGRWGGEEFILFFTDIDLEESAKICEQIRLKIAQTNFHTEDATFHITVTIALSKFDKTTPYKKVFNDADEALYRGKENGKNQVVVCR